MNDQVQYPPFIRDYGSLLSHFNSEFEELTSNKRGEKFASFVKRLVPNTEIGERFETPRLRQQTHDLGVDLESDSKDGLEMLCVQSKYTLKDVDDFDNVISKFKSFRREEDEVSTKSRKNKPIQLHLLIEAEADGKEHLPKTLRFMLVTSSDLSGIIPRYENSGRPSLSFYKELKNKGLLHIVDGHALIPVLQKAYRKLHILPSNFKIIFEQNYIHMGDVYVGVLAGGQLRKLYDDFGDALFLENIREFLGSVGNRDSLTDVNREMLETLEQQPERFLAKNNGITFRAVGVSEIDSRTISLTEASIVNGCQTTMSIVQQPSDDCFVLVKVVGAEQSWEIAKAANFQNKIDRIDLDLAEYIRPRDIRVAASRAGFGFKYQAELEDSAFAILEVIYQDQVSYQEIRSLFIGLFSYNPNNTIDPDYSQLQIDIIESIYANDPKGEKTFNILFKVQSLIQDAAQKTQETFRGKEYASAFQRFWKDAKPNYRAFLAILALCGCIRQNIYDKDYGLDYPKMLDIIKYMEKLADEHSDLFIRYYRLAFRIVANQIIKDETERAITLKKLYQQMHRAKFSQLYLQLCINADDDDNLRVMQETFLENLGNH